MKPEIKNKLEHYSFPQPKDKEQKVWRYLSLAKFLNLVLTKSLYLSRVDLLGDSHEGSYTKQSSTLNTDAIYTDDNGVTQPLFERRQWLRKTIFVNCWRMDNYESEAMWKLYCPNNEGLAIQTTYSKLTNSIIFKDKVYIGCISYLDYEVNYFNNGNILNLMMHKRKAFEHEKEVRVAKINTSNWNSASIDVIEEGVNIEWDLFSTIERIYVNPYAPQWYFDTVKLIFTELSINIPIEWSNIKSDPYF